MERLLTALLLTSVALAGEEPQQFVKNPAVEMVINFIFAMIFLGIGSFSMWYAGRLALVHHMKLKQGFIIMLIGIVVLGAVKMVMVETGTYVPGDLWIPFSVALIVSIFVAKLVLKVNWLKTIITVILGIIMTALITLPIIITVGGALGYYLATRG
ncbi:MAG: hypothetical protein GXO45_01730 [Aquificae bacterium]|nr:hypothetical protein [Aquificota bacterium]